MKNIVDFLKLPPRILGALSVASGLLLFLPNVIIEKLYMTSFRDKYGFRLSALNSTGLDVVKVRFIGQRQLYNNGTVKVVPLCIRRKQQANPSRRL